MNKIRMSIDDGCASDVRVAELATKYKIPCVFYWPVEWHSLAYDNGYEPLSYGDALGIAIDFEVGSHTITHRHLTKLDYWDAVPEITLSQDMLRRLFPFNRITKFAPPRGYTNDELTEMTLRFYDSQRLTKGEDLVHIHPNSGANDNQDWQELADLKLKYGDIELWGHSWEFDKYNLWEELEGFLNEVAHS